MAGIVGLRVIGSGGIAYVEWRDADTNALIQRLRAPDDDQSFKVRLELEMEDAYGDWQRWKNTRIEAQARGLAALIITALTNRENAAWSDYAAAVNEWRQA